MERLIGAVVWMAGMPMARVSDDVGGLMFSASGIVAWVPNPKNLSLFRWDRGREIRNVLCRQPDFDGWLMGGPCVHVSCATTAEDRTTASERPVLSSSLGQHQRVVRPLLVAR